MTEDKALRLLRKKRTEGLAWIIKQYTPYVSSIVAGILRNRMPKEDTEEVISDAFFALWQKADVIHPGKLKSYLGRTARNKAINKLRAQNLCAELDEDVLQIADSGPELLLEEKELAEIVTHAVESMPEPDREIFICRYYYCYGTDEIALKTRLSPAAVRQRLKRGRDRLRDTLAERIDAYEDENA